MAELFDIFSGTFKKASWIEAVEGLPNARERMQQIAEKKPGQYFLFCVRTHASVAEIQTFAMPHPQPVTKSKAELPLFGEPVTQ